MTKNQVTNLDVVLSKSQAQRHAGAPPLNVAVVLPCYNEAPVIGEVVRQFRASLPTARIYVYDNKSTDASIEFARAAGAVVRSEDRKGKGFVMRRMFADIDADIYVICDSDGTYDATVAPHLVSVLVDRGLDMVVGARLERGARALRPGHEFGNRLLTAMVTMIFGGGFTDMLSGYRILSRRFVKSFPAMSHGFEIETELTIHALELEMPACEVQTEFSERMEGSESKLRSFSDGFRIVWTIVTLLKQERPLILFGGIATALAAISLIEALPIIGEYVKTGLVPRLPTAVLATGTMLLAFLSLFCGLILDTVTRGRRETKRLRYLEQSSIHSVVEQYKVTS